MTTAAAAKRARPRAGFVFNTDVPVDETAQKVGKAAFAPLRRVLEFPEFNAYFAEHEDPANIAKARSRRAGYITIALGTFALLASALAPVLGTGEGVFGVDRQTLVGMAAALSGVLSVVVGGRILHGEAKLRWLCDRMMTERLRSFYFQMFPLRFASILGVVEDREDEKTFEQDRAQWLAAFQARFQGQEQAELIEAVGDDSHDDGFTHPRRGEPVEGPITESMRVIFDYYRQYRIQHQIQYVNIKLSRDAGGVSETDKMRLFSNFSIVAIALIFGMHALWLTLSAFVFPNESEAAAQFSAFSHAVTLILAVLVLGARALEEGLQPAREVERFIHYRTAMRTACTQFDKAETIEDKLSAMESVERLAFDEMNVFLRTHYEARFRM